MKRVLLLLVILAAGVVAASFWVPSNAATVNGSAISRSTLTSALSAIARSGPTQCLLTGSPTGDEEAPSKVANTWLHILVTTRIESQLVASEHVTVTAFETNLARKAFNSELEATSGSGSSPASTCGMSSVTPSASLPPQIAQSFLATDTNEIILGAHAQGIMLTTRALQAFYAAHKSDFETVCFEELEFATKATATTARSQILSGSNSPTGLQTEGSKCFSKSEFSELPATVQPFKVGTISQPLQPTASGAVLLLDTESVGPLPYASAKLEALSLFIGTGLKRSASRIKTAEEQANVHINPRYGRVLEKKGAVPSILTPVHPTPADVLNLGADGGTAAPKAPTSSAVPATTSTPGSG